MNWQPPPVTRCKYVRVRSDAASMRHTATGSGHQFMSLIVNGTAVILYKLKHTGMMGLQDRNNVRKK